VSSVKVNPIVLRWARESAGLTLPEAAIKLGFNKSKNVSAEEKLKALETGAAIPTSSQLLKMSKHYRRPLIAFYLDAPPKRTDHGTDFRNLVDPSSAPEASLLEALLRNIKARQSIVRSALELEDEAKPIPLIGNISIEDGVVSTAGKIRDLIGLDIERYRHTPDIASAFTYLRNCVESTGVFVLIVSDLGSHHSKISLDTFRGFALSDKACPFVVINGNDAKAAWGFTLLHELTHIFLGQTGVSGTGATSRIEKFCNDVASELLLPDFSSSIFGLPKTGNASELLAFIEPTAASLKVSKQMLAYRLFRATKITEASWEEVRALIRQEWIATKFAQRERQKEKEGGPSYYTLVKHRIGSGLIDTVRRLNSSGTLTATRAAQVLGVKVSGLSQVISA
jgi:Zn-dependent peptidase ImmA (M78 family)